MKKYKGLLLRLLMNRSHEDMTPAALKSIPKEISESLVALPVVSSDLLPLAAGPGKIVPMIHYSWIDSFLQPIQKVKKKPLIAILSEEQRKGLSKLANAPLEPPIQSDLLRKFYLNKLYPVLGVDQILPLEYLPDSPFNRLIHLQKNQLIELIDFLGFYDLAHEVRQIVATKSLKDLYKSLSPKQQQFLRQCLHAKDKVVAPKLYLDKWNGDARSLMQLLHRRGLARFAVALSGAHPDLIWYLVHILDTGRGKLLLGQIKESEIPTLSSAVALQVDSAYSFAFQGEDKETV